MNDFDRSYYIFAGLGNPGPEYEMTRHNMGFLVVRSFADKAGLHFKKDNRFSAFIAKGVVNNKTIHLVLPTTYMNRSGLAIRSYLDFFKLDPSRLLVVVDDAALPFGNIRLRKTGSPGGHNGLKSVEACLGTNHYMRLRMGIGSPGDSDLADYVLATFTKEELDRLDAFVDCGVEVLQQFGQGGDGIDLTNLKKG